MFYNYINKTVVSKGDVMKTKEQKVEFYDSITRAKTVMNENIKNGWYIHNCVCHSDRMFGGILVVYEKELETWN